ncbi:MAG TPA: SseB family protein [Fluviicoccus sp.]|nr:SseB family protein [Fluviicoccus sp.]
MNTVVKQVDNSLKDILALMQSSPGQGMREAFYAVFPQSLVYFATPMLPEDWLKASGQADRDYRLPLMVAQAQDGSRGLVVFCDEADVKAAKPDMFAVGMKGKDVIALVLKEGLDAIMVQHGGFWAAIPRADAERLAV